MPPSIQARVSLQPVIAFTHSDQSSLARRLGYGRRSIVRWAADGIPMDRADEVATRLGVHPCELWSDWFSG